MTRRDHTDALVGQACGEASRCMARAVIIAFDDSLSNERPLNQLQQIDLMQAALMSFDGLREDLTRTFTTIDRLSELTDGAS